MIVHSGSAASGQLELLDSFGNELFWLVRLFDWAEDGNGLPCGRVDQVPVVVQPVRDFSKGYDLHWTKCLSQLKLLLV